MIIDTTDPAILAVLNPLERQVLHGLADRLAMQAWQRRGWSCHDEAEKIAPATEREGDG